MSSNQSITNSSVKTGLVRIQATLWYLVLVWFVVESLLRLFGLDQGLQLAYWGVVMVVGITLIRLVALSETLRRDGSRLWTLGYSLIAGGAVILIWRVIIL